MFKPAGMARIRLIIYRKCFDDVISALQDVGVIQIESLPENAQSLLKSGETVEYKQITDAAQRFRGLGGMLHPRPVKKMLFENIDQLMEQASAVTIDERVLQITKELDGINVNSAELASKLALLKKIDDFTHDLAILNTRNVISFMASGQRKDLDLFDKEVSASVNNMVKTVLKNAIIYSVKKSDEKEFSSLAEKHKRITLEVMPQMRGSIQTNKKEFESELMEHAARKTLLEVELNQISDEYSPMVSAIKEQLDLEVEKIEITNKLGVSAAIVAIEGWVPTDSLKKVEILVRNVTDSRFILEEVKTDEHPPTKMLNPVTTKLFEAFVKFYSIPKSDEIDPTIMFAIAFPIFFGFMVGDAGYGILMLAMALFIIYRLGHPPKGKSRLPKMITGFVGMIVSPNALKILAKSIIPGSIIAIVLGIYFNEWFGFQLPWYATPFDVEMHLPTLLVLAGYVGVFMVSFGFILGFLNKMAEGDKKHAIAKLGWLFAGLGIVIFGLNVLHRASLGTDNISSVASYIMLVGGILTILKFEGVQGMMELPSLISHILSYTRLVGILLASVILASVIDLIFVKGLSHGILLGIVGVIILFIGQAFNIIIAMFEPGIQGARLIYVEFFSKFYEGNGKQFKPFSNDRKHTLTRFKL